MILISRTQLVLIPEYFVHNCEEKEGYECGIRGVQEPGRCTEGYGGMPIFQSSGIGPKVPVGLM